MTPFAEYLDQLEKNLAVAQTSEETHRQALKKLLESGGGVVAAIVEPTRVLDGEPKFSISAGKILLGFIETRPIGENLAWMEKAEASGGGLFASNRDGLSNWILTDYLEFRWYVNGVKRRTARLAERGSDGKLKWLKNGDIKLASLLDAFFAFHWPSLTALEGVHLEIFQHFSSLAHQRIALQNKCVELSVIVTSGLAAAVVGAVLKDVSTSLEKLGVMSIVIVLGLYVFIQLSLLTNYVYQTLNVQAFHFAYEGIIRESASKFIPREAPLRGNMALWGSLASNFQPIILYFSAWVMLAVLCGVTCWATAYGKFDTSLKWWLSDVILIVESSWLFGLLLIHYNAGSDKGGICRYFARDVPRSSEFANNDSRISKRLN
jgi:hypothetical protein